MSIDVSSFAKQWAANLRQITILMTAMAGALAVVLAYLAIGFAPLYYFSGGDISGVTDLEFAIWGGWTALFTIVVITTMETLNEVSGR